MPWSLEHFGHWGNPFTAPANFRLALRLRRFIRAEDIRLVHANEHWIAPHSRWASRMAGVPVICHFRTGLDDLTPRRIRKYGYGKFDRVLLVAEVLRAAMRPHVPDPAKLVVVRDGVAPTAEPPPDLSGRRTCA